MNDGSGGEVGQTLGTSPDRAHSPPAGPTEGAARRAAGALLLATVLWGCGFTWAKAAGEAVHRHLGLPDGSSFGPVFVLGWRFTLASIVVFALAPRARRGWSLKGAARATAVGMMLAVGLVLQHLGLDRTSEAVSAFLTSLTILFVPLILTLALRKPPAPLMWMGVVLATLGVWLLLMTGETPSGFGRGEALGLGCALTFSLYLLAVNAVARSEDAWRMTAGQFLVVGVACFVSCAFFEGSAALRPGAAVAVLTSGRDVWLNTLLLTLFPTLGAFSLLNHYQPKLDPTRAALIYLMEPVVAAAYAWVMVGRGLGGSALAGAALILVANLLVEVLSTRMRPAGDDPDPSAPAAAPPTVQTD